MKNTKSQEIEIIGAKVHNLKNISLKIPKNKFIAISGISGSGKSSLAFNTLYAEGQRRYIESLSSYARQFLGKLQKPDVDDIIGIAPAIAIEQKVISKNSRSTVGTTTEIYDYIKLLFAKIGSIYSPVSGKEVKCHSKDDILNFILNNIQNEILILTEISEPSIAKLQSYHQQGYSRILIENSTYKISNVNTDNFNKSNKKTYLIIDRIINLKKNSSLINRLYDSIETALFEGKGCCIIKNQDSFQYFSNKLEMDGINFERNSVNLFSFNNPYGACKNCEGFGTILDIDENKVVKNFNLSIYEGAISCWNGNKLSKWKNNFIRNSSEYGFPIHTPYKNLTNNQKELIWKGNKKCKGIIDFFIKIDSKRHKVQNRVISARFKSKMKCKECEGSRLRKDALYVKINDKTILDIVNMSMDELSLFFKYIILNKQEKEISKRIIEEIKTRIQYLMEVGLSYLTLSRKTSTLSGGESQRIHLASSLGNNLTGAIYILDEPSIGLHSKDTMNLIKVLKSLKKLGNTVIVVEHDEEIIKNADHIIDLGPKAGINGGELIFEGNLSSLLNSKTSITAKYLNNKRKIENSYHNKSFKNTLKIQGISINNISSTNISIPLECLTLICGVSGSGKSSLIKGAVVPYLEEKFHGKTYIKKNYIKGSISTKKYNRLEFIDQKSIGKSSRSNPVTYIKVYDDIRNLFAKQKLSIARNYKAGYFSFNIDGGRCEKCKGEGEITIEMQFMADIHIVCDECNGTRFKKEILDIKFEGKNIYEILELTVDEAIDFFKKHNQKIYKKIMPLKEVGLGYIKLGQSSSTLSGGEAQRIKLAYFLSKGEYKEQIIFVFDEPTTGLHSDDINNLMNAFQSLINKGHSIICVEHNLDVIKCADWAIELGPKGGSDGGKIIFEGIPSEMKNNKHSITGNYIP